jgi:hypothetical protein
MEMFDVELEMANLLRDLSDEDLRDFAELQEESASDAQIELFIYTCFLIFTRTASTEYLARAIGRAEGWVAVTPDDHPQSARRSKILDTMSARLRERRHMLEDLSLPNLMRGRLVTIPIALIPAQATRIFKAQAWP